MNIKNQKKAVLFSHQSMHRYTVNLLAEIHTTCWWHSKFYYFQNMALNDGAISNTSQHILIMLYRINTQNNLSWIGEISSSPRKQMVYTHCSKENVMLEPLFHGHDVMNHKLISEKQCVNHF